jgi:hypothetical protein
VLLTSRIGPEEIARLHAAVRESLAEWTERLRAEAAGGFPEGVTAFRKEMAVHGKYGEACPVCGTRSSGSGMRRMRRTIVRSARRAGGCWRTVR